jgi:hypothetical protein
MNSVTLTSLLINNAEGEVVFACHPRQGTASDIVNLCEVTSSHGGSIKMRMEAVCTSETSDYSETTWLYTSNINLRVLSEISSSHGGEYGDDSFFGYSDV